MNLMSVNYKAKDYIAKNVFFGYNGGGYQKVKCS